MLGELDRTAVISESPAIDEALRDRDGDAVRALLDAELAAAGDTSRLFVKLDSWAVFDLDLLRELYPQVPWVFLYRAPAEIVASHLRERGMHTVPGELPTELFGLDEAEARAMGAPEYCARVTGAILDAAARRLDRGCLLLAYEELPGAVAERLLPAFGASPGPRELARVIEAADFDSKRPGLPYEPRTEAPPASARAAAESWAEEPFTRLEAARAAQRGVPC